MKLETLQDVFKGALAVVAPAVAGKSTLPVLSHVQLTADDTGLWLAATNLECGIKTRIGARVERHGAVCIPHKLLSDIIGGLPNVPISLALDERTQTITIKAEKFKTEIKGIESDEFPVLVTSGGDPLFSMPGSDWHTVADKVAIAAAPDNSRPALFGVHVWSTATGSGVTFEAADMYRLARKRFDIDSAAIDTIIPAAALTTARKVFAGDADVSLAMANSGALAIFKSDDTTLTSRVIDGTYPDCERIIPTSYGTRIVAPVADVLTRLRLAKFVAVTSSNIVRLGLTVLDEREGKLVITANAAEVADLSDAVDVIASGKDTQIALNILYLLDAVGACGAGDMAIELQSSQHPAVLRAVGDDSYLHVLMPMSIRGD
jgi:DNA polymerase-3 subunit beta